MLATKFNNAPAIQDLIEARLYFGDVVNFIFEDGITRADLKKQIQKAMSSVLKRADPKKKEKLKSNMEKSMNILLGWIPAVAGDPKLTPSRGGR